MIISSGIIFGQAEWEFDKSHAKIGFSVTRLVIAEVEGKFAEYEGTITTEHEYFGTAKINLDIDLNSIQTDIAARDKHLESDDFFSPKSSRK